MLRKITSKKNEPMNTRMKKMKCNTCKNHVTEGQIIALLWKEQIGRENMDTLDSKDTGWRTSNEEEGAGQSGQKQNINMQ